MGSLYGLYYSFWGYGLIGTVFYFWMIVDCLRNEPERYFWIWVMIILNIPGALIYFVLRKLPNLNLRPPAFLNRLLQQQKLRQAEFAVRNIGNCHQYVECGDILVEQQQYQKADEMYAKALEKDKDSVIALWAKAQTEIELKKYAEAKQHLETLLAQDPGYKFGEASLVYGRALYAMKDFAAAKLYFEKHLKRNTHVEAQVYYASLLAQDGEKEKAEHLLQSIFDDMHGTPSFFYKQHRDWLNKAKKLMRQLKSGGDKQQYYIPIENEQSKTMTKGLRTGLWVAGAIILFFFVVKYFKLDVPPSPPRAYDRMMETE